MGHRSVLPIAAGSCYDFLPRPNAAPNRMIISASRRTDIPAFHAAWLMDRIRAGACEVPNPVVPSVVSHVSLLPEDVEAIVFWTKNPAPMEGHLDELDRRGHRFAFLYTVNDYPADIEPGVPPLADRLAAFRRLALRLGPDRVVWRYDPIILSPRLDAGRHRRAFAAIAAALSGHTRRAIVSFLDFYRKTERRMAEWERRTGDTVARDWRSAPGCAELAKSMADAADAAGMEIQSCAEDPELQALGIRPGKCIDDSWLRRALGVKTDSRKDPGQRERCGCVRARDIGTHGTCGHGCLYCYAARACAAPSAGVA